MRITNDLVNHRNAPDDAKNESLFLVLIKILEKFQKYVFLI